MVGPINSYAQAGDTRPFGVAEYSRIRGSKPRVRHQSRMDDFLIIFTRFQALHNPMHVSKAQRHKVSNSASVLPATFTNPN